MADLKFSATSLDLLAEGKLFALGDVMIQRIKAIQLAVADGGWSTATRRDMSQSGSFLLASEPEQHSAARAEVVGRNP